MTTFSWVPSCDRSDGRERATADISRFSDFDFSGFVLFSRIGRQMNGLDKSPAGSIRDITLISAIAADPELSHAATRLAVALVLMTNDAGEAKGKTAALAAACRIERRRVVRHLRRLATSDYIRLIDMSRPGRFHVELSDAPLERLRFNAAIDAALSNTVPIG